MAKLPKVPRGIRPPRPPAPQRPQPLPYRAPQLKPQSKPQQSPKSTAPETTSLEEKNRASLRWKKVWDERPKVVDIRKLSPEERQATGHTMKVRRWRQWPIMVCGLAAFGMGLYATQLYISLTHGADEKDIPEDLSDRFDKEAEGYDEKVDLAETLLLLSKRRKDITRKVRGHVLEVAVGTGRNISYYPTKQCATVTLLDSSAPMLAVAKRKWKDAHPEYFSRVFFKQQSAIDPITPPYGAQEGYDTVLQTMGLCSTPEPVKLLRNLEAATKEDGRIMLLEHGRSHYDWVNSMLDKTAPGHADLHGCWWNKDIGKIVEESGLEIVDVKRYNFGTTWWIELKPRKGMRRYQGAGNVEQAVAPVAPLLVTQRPWWSLWR